MKQGDLKRSHYAVLELLSHVEEDKCLVLRHDSVKKLVRLGLVERVEEEGFRDGYRLTPEGRQLLAGGDHA